MGKISYIFSKSVHDIFSVLGVAGFYRTWIERISTMNSLRFYGLYVMSYEALARNVVLQFCLSLDSQGLAYNSCFSPFEVFGDPT